jgi:hypothetical protein
LGRFYKYGVNQTCTSLQCTGLSGVHQTVFGAQAGTPDGQTALGKNSALRGYNSPDCPVCIELSGEPTANGQLRQQLTATGVRNR